MTAPSAATSVALKTAGQPLSANERRVLGVLIEKAKTTPDAYPLSLNAIRTGCNQKNNRHPVVELDEDAVRDAVDGLREKGAAIEVQGGGRVPRFRHMGYEWLGLDKREIAVMAELLLRGPQTVGELRSHVARMEPLADLAALQPLMDGLKAKGLLITLTPEGRGQVVCHALYSPDELKRIRAEHAAGGGEHTAAPTSSPAARVPQPTTPSAAAPHAAPAAEKSGGGNAEQLRGELAETKAQLAQLRSEMQALRAAFEQELAAWRRFREELGG
jgi:uncharacterized protein YceH (UPF0502 family)